MEPGAFTYESLRGAIRHPDGLYYAAAAFGSGVYVSRSGCYWRRAVAPADAGQPLALLRDRETVQAVFEKATFALRQRRWKRLTDGYLLARGPAGVGINCLIAVKRGTGQLPGTVPRFFPEPVSCSGRLFWRAGGVAADRRRLAADKRAVYFYTWLGRPFSRFRRFIDRLKGTGINAVVIDMKDDYGNVVYDSKLDIVCRVRSRKVIIDVKQALALLKSRGLYSIARLVVFKDARLWGYRKGMYAIKDSRHGGPWVGGYTQKEYWVDAHAPFAWKYNIAIAAELAALGFDEIQFDYIRFPTDGPVYRCKYEWKKPGQTKSDVLTAFLKSARAALRVPISVDIYGFNGWYRMGDKQGQDIRKLRDYVDVVCPMYYPSHFGRSFMRQDAYRILKEGARRNVWLSGNRVLVRPYLQAFPYLARPWGIGYINRQRRGVADGGGSGYTYWNMRGNYRVALRAERGIGK